MREVGIIAHSPAFLHLLRMQWDGIHWVDSLDQRNSERESGQESDTDLWEDHASYSPDVDDVYSMR